MLDALNMGSAIAPGTSDGSLNIHPRCSSAPGLVRSHTGATMLTEIAFSSPFSARTDRAPDAHGHAYDAYLCISPSKERIGRVGLYIRLV